MRNTLDDSVRIPRQAARDLAGFRAWAVSRVSPGTAGSISWPATSRSV